VSAAYLSDAQSFRSSRKVPLDLLVRVAHACNSGALVVEFQDKCDPKTRADAIASFRSRIRRASSSRSTSK
jgi:hypothetical protein